MNVSQLKDKSMNTFLRLLIVFLIAAISHMEAQVTNLMVNGSSTNFTMTTGGTVSWSYNLPVGATADGELWYDINGNGIIEPGTDVARFIFTQTDGDTNGNGGPPDTDGLVNGACTFSQALG